MEEFVDWLWKFFVDDRLMTYQQYVDAKNKGRETAPTPKATKSGNWNTSASFSKQHHTVDILQSGRLKKASSAKTDEDNDKVRN